MSISASRCPALPQIPLWSQDPLLPALFYFRHLGRLEDTRCATRVSNQRASDAIVLSRWILVFSSYLFIYCSGIDYRIYPILVMADWRNRSQWLVRWSVFMNNEQLRVLCERWSPDARGTAMSVSVTGADFCVKLMLSLSEPAPRTFFFFFWLFVCLSFKPAVEVRRGLYSYSGKSSVQRSSRCVVASLEWWVGRMDFCNRSPRARWFQTTSYSFPQVTRMTCAGVVARSFFCFSQIFKYCLYIECLSPSDDGLREL